MRKGAEVFSLVLAGVIGARAQGTPPVCVEVEARQTGRAGGRLDSERAYDTERIAAALRACAGGQAVRLRRSADGSRDAFLIGPLGVPAGRTLWVDAGVTVYGSRDRAVYGAGDREGPCWALLCVGASEGSGRGVAAGLMGSGVIDGRGRAGWVGGGSWEGLPPGKRPALVETRGGLRLDQLTLRGAMGIALRYGGAGGLAILGAKFVGGARGVGTAGLVLEDGAEGVSIRDTTISTTGEDVLMGRGARVTIENVSVYGGLGIVRAGGVEERGANRCVANSDGEGAIRCVAASLPLYVGTLIAEESDGTGIRLTAVVVAADAGTPEAGGDVEFFDGETLLGSAEIQGTVAEWKVGETRAGAHRFHAVYAGLRFGDEALGGKVRGRAETTDPTSTALTASATTLSYGDTVMLTATVLPAGATGVVVFTDAMQGVLGQGATAGGVATLRTSSLGLKMHSVTAQYGGDGGFSGSESGALGLRVDKAASIVSLDAVPATLGYGMPLVLRARVVPAWSTGQVSFADRGTPVGAGVLAGGVATLMLKGPAVGSHSFTASYAGDEFAQGSASTEALTLVAPMATTCGLAGAPAAAVYGTGFALRVSVLPGDATGAVVFRDSVAGVLGQGGLAGGGAGVSVAGTALGPGVHVLAAEYAGDATHAGCSGTQTAVIAVRTSAATLGPVPATGFVGGATMLVVAIVPAAATGVVVFADANSGVLGQATVVDGVATMRVTGLGVGAHSFSASYGGDAYDGPSTTGAVEMTIALNPAGVMLGPLPVSTPYGAPLRLTATVSPGDATGLVRFLDGGSGLGAPGLVAGGTATVTLTGIAVGAHVFAASYGGDATYAAAVSAGVAVSVVPAASVTTLAVAQRSVPAGVPVVLNVEVMGASGGTPTGVVTVRGGGTVVLGTVRLAGGAPGRGYGTVTIDSAKLGVGTYGGVAAFYAGDAGDEASDSAGRAVVFAVVPAATATVLTVAGQVLSTVPVAVRATVTSPYGVAVGMVTYMKDGVEVGSGVLDAQGVANGVLPAMRPGSYALVARFEGAGLFGGSVSDAQAVTITPPLAIALEPGTVDVRAGGTADAALLITPLAGFSGALAATCLSTVSYVGCTVEAPASVGGGVVGHGVVHVRVKGSLAGLRVPGGVGFALVLPMLWRRKRRWRAVAAGLLLGFVLGCGSGGSLAIPPGPEGVTVTVTAAGIGAVAEMRVNVAD